MIFTLAERDHGWKVWFQTRTLEISVVNVNGKDQQIAGYLSVSCNCHIRASDTRFAVINLQTANTTTENEIWWLIEQKGSYASEASVRDFSQLLTTAHFSALRELVTHEPFAITPVSERLRLIQAKVHHFTYVLNYAFLLPYESNHLHIVYLGPTCY